MDGRQIAREMQNQKGFVGVFTLDELPKPFPESASAIVNLDKSDQPGSHWVGVFKNNVLEWFDPLGNRPPEDAIVESCIINRARIQDEDSIACGAFALDFVKRRIKGEDFASIIFSYTDNAILNDLLI